MRSLPSSPLTVALLVAIAAVLLVPCLRAPRGRRRLLLVSVAVSAGMVFVLIGLSAHPVWIGLIFAYLFGYELGLTPIAGYCDFFSPSASAGSSATARTCSRSIR